MPSSIETRGRIAEVAAGGVDVEPVGGGELAGEEPGHRRLAREARARGRPPSQAAPASEGERRGDGPRDGRQVRGAEDAVDQVPERPGLALREEVGPAGDRRAGREAVGGEEVGLGGVVDVGRVDERSAGGRSAAAGPPGPGR